MNKSSRTDNAIKNTKITLICYIIYLISSFICRTILTKKLGAEYLGIGGLFSNILTILSFAELGIGSTLVYRLYKPFENEEYNKINCYLQLFKKIYRFIMLFILVAGICVIPFLKYLVDAPNIKESITTLYLLYLIQAVTSYFFIYKKTILTADQKDYIVTLFNEIVNVIMNIIQCLILIFIKSYIAYLIVSIICSIINNIICSWYVDKKYTFLKDKTDEKISKEDLEKLKKDTKGLVMTKVASTAFTGTDNIFISSFIGIKYVGIISNYTLILTIVNTLMNKIFSSITASVGNFAISKNNGEEIEKIFFKMFFINTAMYSYICVGLAIFIGEFVTKYWCGMDFDLNYTIILLLMIELYLRSIHYPLYITRNALGLFSQYRMIFVLAATMNIVLDFILVRPFGLLGLIVSTIICRCICYVTDIYVVYKYGLKKTSRDYYIRILKWIIFTLIFYIISLIVYNSFEINFWFFIIKIIIISIIYLIWIMIFYGKNSEMKYFIDLLIDKI